MLSTAGSREAVNNLNSKASSYVTDKFTAALKTDVLTKLKLAAGFGSKLTATEFIIEVVSGR